MLLTHENVSLPYCTIVTEHKKKHIYTVEVMFQSTLWWGGRSWQADLQTCRLPAQTPPSRIWYVKRDPCTAPQQLSLERGATHISDGLYFTLAGSQLICGAVFISSGATNNSFLLTLDLFAVQPPSFLMHKHFTLLNFCKKRFYFSQISLSLQ